jgi:hypothetical protein
MIPVLAVLALVAVACGTGAAGSSPDSTAAPADSATPEPTSTSLAGTTSDPAPDTTSPTTAADPTTTRASGGLPQGPSALESREAPEFPAPLVNLSDIFSGGPPPDGIPPIDRPAFVDVAAADEWLDDAESVVALELAGEARAYPVQVLIWHEIVNDVVGDLPVSITYCPLCNSAVTYERVIDGVETTFGTSGLLFNSALVMYDRATESLWTHFDGRAVVGMLAGTALEPIASPLLAWGEFKQAHPDGLVLDRNATGYSRSYGTNPYAGYDNEANDPFLFRGVVDDRAAAMRRVVGVALEDAAAAWALDGISGEEAEATNTAIGDQNLVILWKSGQASALADQSVATGDDVGSVGVFDPTVDDTTLTFSATGDRFVDDQTGSEWDITGAAISGELAGTQLARVPHLDTFWFAWATYRPGTDLIE